METQARQSEGAAGAEGQTDPAVNRATWRHRLRRPWVVFPLAAVLAVGVWWFGFRSSGSSASAASSTEQLVAVTKGPIGNSVSAEGTVAAAQTADLNFAGSGTVSKGCT